MLRLALVIVLFTRLLLTLRGGIVEHDFRVPGDGLLTYDEIQNREWLDLTETFGWHLPTLQEALSPGGSLHGFKLAMMADLEGLASAAGVSWIPPWQFPGVEGSESNRLIELVGFIPDQADDSPGIPTNIPPGTDYGDIVYLPSGPFGPLVGSMGFVADEDGEVSGMAVVVIGSGDLVPGQVSFPLSYQSSGGIFAYEFELDSNIGPYWLYRNVPEPSAFYCIALFTGWLATRRRQYFLAA